MGNALGEYIHAKYEDYLKYGLHHVGEAESYPNINDILQSQRKKIKKQAYSILGEKRGQKTQIKEDLEKQLNSFFNETTLIPNKDGEQVSISIQNAIIQSLKEHLLPTGFEIDENLYVTQTDKSLSAALGELSTKVNLTSVKSIFSRIDNLVKAAQKQQQAKGELGKNWSNWLMRALQLEEEFNKLEKDVKNFSYVIDNSFGEQKWAYKPITEKGRNILYGNGKEQGLIERLNILYNEAQNGTRAYWAGQVGEIYPLIIQEISKRKITNITTDLISSIAKTVTENTYEYGQRGSESSKAVMKGSLLTNFSGQIRDKQRDESGTWQINDYVAGLGKMISKVHYTQDKVDIILDLGNESFQTSVKNYNLSNKQPITLLSGQNILYYLQDYPRFLNHYMNITVQHFSLYPPEGTKSNHPDLQTVFYAHQTMLFSLALKAISGGVWKQNKDGEIFKSPEAELFIVNDSSKGHYSVHFIDDFIDLLEKNMSYLIAEGDIPEKNRWSAEWIDGPKSHRSAYKRILGILNELQSAKIHLSISQKALDQF